MVGRKIDRVLVFPWHGGLVRVEVQEDANVRFCSVSMCRCPIVDRISFSEMMVIDDQLNGKLPGSLSLILFKISLSGILSM